MIRGKNGAVGTRELAAGRRERPEGAGGPDAEEECRTEALASVWDWLFEELGTPDGCVTRKPGGASGDGEGGDAASY